MISRCIAFTDQPDSTNRAAKGSEADPAPALECSQGLGAEAEGAGVFLLMGRIVYRAGGAGCGRRPACAAGPCRTTTPRGE